MAPFFNAVCRITVWTTANSLVLGSPPSSLLLKIPKTGSEQCPDNSTAFVQLSRRDQLIPGFFSLRHNHLTFGKAAECSL